jgi:hypothetical protein
MIDQQKNEVVARRLGWEKLDPPIIDEHESGWRDIWKWIRPDAERKMELPDYCRSIEAAWEIVEHLKFKASFDLVWNKRAEQWHLELTELSPTDSFLCEVEADTAPMAIVEAFLKLDD